MCQRDQQSIKLQFFIVCVIVIINCRLSAVGTKKTTKNMITIRRIGRSYAAYFSEIVLLLTASLLLTGREEKEEFKGHYRISLMHARGTS